MSGRGSAPPGGLASAHAGSPPLGLPSTAGGPEPSWPVEPAAPAAGFSAFGTSPSHAVPGGPRPARILWFSLYSLLDTSSGAAMAVREMLRQLARRGHQVHVIGATVFDSPGGRLRVEHDWAKVQQSLGTVLAVDDAPLRHEMFVTGSTAYDQLTARELGVLHAYVASRIDEIRPDLVAFYGGQVLEMLVADEVRRRGIPVAAYLGNSSYAGTRWCRDVDLLLTDSEATRQFYAHTQGYAVTAVGPFIDPNAVLAARHTRERILFVNPSLEKGATVVAALALALERVRPDLCFEVVESRGRWADVVRLVSTALGTPRDALGNVVVTPHTDDMRPVYGRARVLLAPSLCVESAGRVLVEALLNGVPAIVSERGGMPEMLQGAGVHLNFPDEFYQPPYDRIPLGDMLAPLVQMLLRFHDDAAWYDSVAQRAVEAGRRAHGLEASTARLEAALAPWLARRAGDRVPAPASRPATAVPR